MIWKVCKIHKNRKYCQFWYDSNRREFVECRLCRTQNGLLNKIRLIERDVDCEFIIKVRTCLPNTVFDEDNRICSKCVMSIRRWYGFQKEVENIETWRKENPSEPVPETLIQRQINFQCIHCAKGYKTPKGLNDHMKKSHHLCCKQTFNSSNDFKVHCIKEHGCSNDYCGEKKHGCVLMKNHSSQSAAVIKNNNATDASIVTNINDQDIKQQQDDGNNDDIVPDDIDGKTDTEQSASENNIALEWRKKNAVKRPAKALENNDEQIIAAHNKSNSKRRRKISTVSSVEPVGSAQISNASNNSVNLEKPSLVSNAPFIQFGKNIRKKRVNRRKIARR